MRTSLLEVTIGQRNTACGTGLARVSVASGTKEDVLVDEHGVQVRDDNPNILSSELIASVC
jgi:hypothetical protein